MAYVQSNMTFKNGIPLSNFLGYVDPIGSADTAAGSSGFVYVDADFTITGDATLSATWIGTGGLLTLGSHNLTGNFWAPASVQIFNVNSTGRAKGIAGNEIHATWFGAADGIDCTVAINAAIKYAQTNTNGSKNRKIILPSGSLHISDQILTFDGISLEGQGTEGTVIFLTAVTTAISTNGALRIGDGSTQAYGTRFSNMTLDVNNQTGAIGCYTADAQDGSGFAHMIVKNVKDGKGVWINGSAGPIGFCNNYFCQDIFVEKNNGSDGGTAFQIDGGTLPGSLGNLTVDAVGGGKFTYGYYFKDAAPICFSLSIDSGSVVTGVNISTGCLYTEIRGLTILGNNATGVNIESQTVPALITSYFYSGGGNALVDAGGGSASAKTISGNATFPFYSRAQSTYINGLVNFVTLPTSDPGVSGELWSNVHVVTQSP